MTRVLKLVGSTVGAAAAVYGGYVALTYLRFGRTSDHAAGNPLLDRFLPEHEVRERHSVRVAASAEITFARLEEEGFSVRELWVLPRGRGSLMSYCDNGSRWVSIYLWQRLYNRLA